MILANAKILPKQINDDIIIIRCRLSKGSKLANARSESTLNVHLLDVPSDSPAILSHEAAVRVMIEYLGYLPAVDPSNAMYAGHVARSIITLARLGALIATTVSSRREDSSDKVGVINKSLANLWLPAMNTA